MEGDLVPQLTIHITNGDKMTISDLTTEQAQLIVDHIRRTPWVNLQDVGDQPHVLLNTQQVVAIELPDGVT